MRIGCWRRIRLLLNFIVLMIRRGVFGEFTGCNAVV
jgi:hypothetical protein